MKVRPGETVTMRARVRNDGLVPIDYMVPRCQGAASLTFAVALPLKPAGRQWHGLAQTFKDYALSEGYGPGGVPATDPVRLDIPETPCREGHFEAVLAPRVSVSSSFEWKAEIVGGVSTLPGELPFSVTVGYDRQDEPPSLPPNVWGPIGSTVAVYTQLRVDGSILVDGPAQPILSAGEAIDVLLGDPTFAGWLRQRPPATWANANLFLVSSPAADGIVPAGPSWNIELFREVGVPRNWAIAFVDPFAAVLRSVTYCDIPCDR
jgi:hypothetical protein